MRTALAYYSVTGHSKKIGGAVANALQIPIYNLKTDTIPEPLDCLFVVGGIYGGKSDALMLNQLSHLDGAAVRQAILISSSASGFGRQDQARALLQSRGIQVLSDEYVCMGNFLIVRLGHPNQAEVDGAVRFARQALAQLNA